MPKSSQSLDQVVLDSYNCYIMFLIDKEDNILISTNFSDRENSLKQFADLFIQMQTASIIKTAVVNAVSKMKEDEIQLFLSYIVDSSDSNGSDPVIQPLQNYQENIKSA